MNTPLLCQLMRERILEAHRIKAMTRERPPCMPKIRAEMTKLGSIDAAIRAEVRNGHH